MPGTSGTSVGIECDVSGTFLFCEIVAARASIGKQNTESTVNLTESEIQKIQPSRSTDKQKQASTTETTTVRCHKNR